MTVCKYFLAGKCKFGDQCRYDHVDANGNIVSAMSDPFAAPSSQHKNQRSARQQRDTPQWPLTCVGAHPLSSGNAVTGDMSQEELRAQAYALAPRGMSQEIAQHEDALVKEHQLRVNGESANSSQARMAADPFAGQQASTQPSTQGLPQQQPFQQQIFNTQPNIQQKPIFPTSTPAATPLGFSAPMAEGFASAVSQQQLPIVPGMPQPTVPTVTSAVNQATPAPLQPPGTGTETFPQAQFAFQKVPETAPPTGFQ